MRTKSSNGWPGATSSSAFFQSRYVLVLMGLVEKPALLMSYSSPQRAERHRQVHALLLRLGRIARHAQQLGGNLLQRLRGGSGQPLASFIRSLSPSRRTHASRITATRSVPSVMQREPVQLESNAGPCAADHVDAHRRVVSPIERPEPRDQGGEDSSRMD